MYCVLQIGCFRAKHAFFHFDWSMVEDDCAFVLSRYFHGETFEGKEITKHEHYTQHSVIADLFGYRLWSTAFQPALVQQAAQIVRRDVTPGCVAAELIVWLNDHKIVRPGYTTLQELISEALSAERRRLGDLLATVLDEPAKAALVQLIVRDDTLSELAVLRQDAKDFRWRQMAREREKRAILDPVYQIAKALVPKLGISQQNLRYYASLANFYTVYDLRRLRPEQTHLYLVCYAWLRYRQLTDNLVDALTFDADGRPTGLHADRYVFWLYRQVRKRLRSGELFLDDSLQHRHFSDELVSPDEQTDRIAVRDHLGKPLGHEQHAQGGDEGGDAEADHHHAVDQAQPRSGQGAAQYGEEDGHVAGGHQPARDHGA